MGDRRSIGIFDSGLGGLTVAKEIYATLPFESTVYIGDTARVPYGNRSPETIVEFSLELAHELVKHQVKAIVVACATASSLALDALKSTFPDLPILGVIEPTAAMAVQLSKSQHIGLIGTRATINSHAFQRAATDLNPEIKVYAKSCPLFVPLIEEGITTAHPILSTTIDYYLKDLSQTPIDTLILGCTHYPMIETAIRDYLPKATTINPGVALAQDLKQLLIDHDLSTDSADHPKHHYFATDKTDNFTTTARLFLGRDIDIEKLVI